MHLSWSPYVVLMIDGQGDLIHKLPWTLFPFNSLPSASTITGITPGNGNEAWAGLLGVIPASAEIIIPPVSVCHHVSTKGHFPLPTLSWYQCHASSFIGSPTDPITFNESSELFSSGSRPWAWRARIAVGAV